MGSLFILKDFKISNWGKMLDLTVQVTKWSIAFIFVVETDQPYK